MEKVGYVLGRTDKAAAPATNQALAEPGKLDQPGEVFVGDEAKRLVP
jgi:hypothetical protein